MRVVLAGLMLAAAFSGCLGGSDEGGDAGAVVGAGDAGVNATVANRLPVANLTADAVNGTAPLNVTFTLAFSDADQDDLTWTLTLGNTSLANGTSGDAGNATSEGSTATTGNATGNSTGNSSAAGASRQVSHQFTEAGNYTVVLNLTDGTNSTSANITITVHPGGNATATAGEGPIGEDDYAVFNADGTCDAKGEVDLGGEYIHHRGGDSIWWFEESNGIDGLQVGGSGPLSTDTDYPDCLNADFLIF